jgi:hypothetical protein
MQIFATEKADGLEEALSTKASVTYAALVEKTDIIPVNKSNIKVLAGIEDKDLYYTQSILVTTSWNKNDDVFDKQEVWAAKNTPNHKPTNLEHDEGTIVGHITSNWPMTEEGVLIDDSTPAQNLPDKFHILTGSVIYVGYTEPELRERAQKLISEIENGTKYVSMECFFEGFDYGLLSKATGEYKILARNEETSFLTKHLRSYGGIGEHENYKVGRVLRNITFSGKGFVDKPANPESIIFTKDSLHFDRNVATIEIIKQKNDNFEKVGVFSNQANLKENDMNLENEVAEIKQKIETMIESNTSLAEIKSVASDLQIKNTELQTALKAQELSFAEVRAALELAISEKEQATKKMAEDMKKKEEEMQKMKADYDASNEVIAAYKDKEAEMMKKEKKMKRMASLMQSGLDNDVALSTVDKFESLDDEAFDSIAAVFAAMMPDKKKKMEEEAMVMKMNKKASEDTSVVDSDILDTAEVEDSVNLSVGNEIAVSVVENTRAALVDFVYDRLGKKLNKGE